MTLRQVTGDLGESLVAAHLERHGFQIVARNARVGRLELDVIAKRDDLLVFCEVRARRSRAFLNPIESIDHQKVARIRRAAAQWLAAHPQGTRQIRFDAAAVVFDREPPAIEYYEAAF
ncbi:MAG: YraN family protein [Myxococcales bacterium]